MTAKHDLGQYYTTHIELKEKVFAFILNSPSNILEPSIGRGDLITFINNKLPNITFDMYEIDNNIAKNIDEACLSCPVIDICFKNGTTNDEYGVWGGVYLNAGLIDKSRNLHKTAEVWKRLKKKNVY